MILLVLISLYMTDCFHCATQHSFELYSSHTNDFVESKTDTGVYLVGEWPFGSFNSMDYDSVRNIWFIGSGKGVFIMEDISVSTDLRHILSDNIRTGSWVHDIDYRGSDSVLFVATYSGVIQAWNVKDVYNPVYISEFTLGQNLSINRIQINGDYLYAIADSTLFIMNIANPDTIVLKGTYSSSVYIKGFKVSENYAYLSCGDSGVVIVNITDPASPQTESRFSFSGNAVDVDVRGDYMYVADSLNGLRIVDVQLPSSPVEIGIYSGNAQGVKVSGNNVYIPEFGYNVESDTLIALDVSDPSNPEVIWKYEDYMYFTKEIMVVDSYLYLCKASAISVYDISDTSSVHIQSVVTSPAGGGDVVVQGDSVLYYVGRSFVSMDIKDPAHPVANVMLSLPEGGLKEVVDGDYAYIISCTHLNIVNIQDAFSPELVSSWWVPGGAPFRPSCYVYDLSVKDNYVYLAKDDERSYNPNGILAVNVSNHYSPDLVGYYNGAGMAKSVEVVGNYAYLADGLGLYVLDIQDPTSIDSIGYLYAQWSAEDIKANGRYLYVAAGDSGVIIINISNPAQPVEIARCDVEDAFSIFPTDTFLYVSTGSGVEIVSITDPLNPEIVTSINPDGPVYNVWVSDPYIYITSSNVVEIYRSTLVGIDESRKLKTSNSFVFSVTPIGKSIELRYFIPNSMHPVFKIYDRTGRVVKTIDEGLKSSGNYTVQLNNLKSGVYFVGIKDGNAEHLQKFVVVK